MASISSSPFHSVLFRFAYKSLRRRKVLVSLLAVLGCLTLVISAGTSSVKTKSVPIRVANRGQLNIQDGRELGVHYLGAQKRHGSAAIQKRSSPKSC